MEIGGYLELEQLAGAEYYTNMRKLNLGRTAIRYAVQALQVEELWLPRYLCDSMQDACAEAGCRLVEYSNDSELNPLLEQFAPAEHRWVLLVNYYGQYSQQRILAWQALWQRVIVDNTQAFFQPPVEGVPTLYSLRKYFGLPDGAYLSLPEWCQDDALYSALPQDCSDQRMGHLLGRYEHGATAYYQQMLDTAHSYYQMPIRKMSRLTENLLGGIPYQRACDRRQRNWQVLQQLLGDCNPLAWPMPQGPFCYPFYHKDAADLKRALAARGIFVPTYWKNVVADLPEESVEHDLAAHILPLPCDQRYGQVEMEQVASALRALL